MLKGILLCLCLALGSTPGTTKTDPDFEQRIRKAVFDQIERYPASSLKDLYKNFFQDVFGPGHLIADTAAAGRYLRQELDSFSESHDVKVEPLGWRNEYYRVSLSLLKEGTIPYAVYFDAFVRSVNEITPLTLEEWRGEWMRIEAIISSYYPDIPGYESDKKEIEERLAEGRYVGHHSPAFNRAYAPHYRIIRKDVFENELLPYIQKRAE